VSALWGRHWLPTLIEASQSGHGHLASMQIKTSGTALQRPSATLSFRAISDFNQNFSRSEV
jgi:hypothetical protein